MWLALVIATPLTSSAPAQVPPAAKADAAKAAKPANLEEAEAAAPIAPKANAPQEIFPDNLSKQAIQVFNPLTYPAPPFKIVGTPNERSDVQSMASNSIAADEKKIRRYVEFYAAELSKRENLNAFITPGPNVNVNAAKAIERAVTDLIAPITVARANNNSRFLSIYTRQLFDSSFPKLLDNNLFARIDAMIVLGMLGSAVPKDLDVYIEQINKPDQVMWVKQWAARGISNATNDGKNPLDATKTIQALEALTKFLGGDAKAMPWPVQIRALEAIGSLRTAVSISQRGRIDAASVVMPYLVDPSMRIEVRAYAARSLGLMIPPASVRPYNFALLGDAVGQVAADIGDRIVNEFDQNAADFVNHSDEATRLTSLLLFQVFAGVAGEPGAKDSGLIQMNHPDARSQSAYFKDLSDRIQLEAKTAVDFLKAPSADQKGLRDKIAGQVKDLRGFLESKAPKDRRLVPDGPTFAIAPAPADAAKK